MAITRAFHSSSFIMVAEAPTCRQVTSCIHCPIRGLRASGALAWQFAGISLNEMKATAWARCERDFLSDLRTAVPATVAPPPNQPACHLCGLTDSDSKESTIESCHGQARVNMTLHVGDFVTEMIEAHFLSAHHETMVKMADLSQ